MKLNRCPKCSPETGIRIMPPAETLKRVLPLLGIAGLGAPEDITHVDNLGIPVFSIDRQETALGKPKYYNGKGVTVGNSTELKNVILFQDCEVPHYNYVGDSILGVKAHLGAGAITSNIKADRKNVVVKDGTAHYETGLRKFGAMLGDHVEVGCNSVLNPGTVVGRWTNIYPLSMVRGVVPEYSIYKSAADIVHKES